MDSEMESTRTWGVVFLWYLAWIENQEGQPENFQYTAWMSNESRWKLADEPRIATAKMRPSIKLFFPATSSPE